MSQVRAAVQPTTLGRYTLIERIGTGGQGEVWRAHDESRGVDVALKVLAPSAARNPEAWAMLEREHEIASRLQHAGILQILPPERIEAALVLPMELASGGDLSRLRGASYLEIVPVLLEAAEALEYAHARGVVHRDLKPGNVLFDGRGRVKIGDFGIAALLPAAGAPASEPRGTGHSPFSASPEQLRGEPPSAADDIYGLGALAYELLSGHPPYYPNFDLNRVLTQPVPELTATRQIPPELGRIVLGMLAKSAAQRPATMQQVMDELETTLNATLCFSPAGAEAEDGAESRADDRPLRDAEDLEADEPEAPEPVVSKAASTASPAADDADRIDYRKIAYSERPAPPKPLSDAPIQQPRADVAPPLARPAPEPELRKPQPRVKARAPRAPVGAGAKKSTGAGVGNSPAFARTPHEPVHSAPRHQPLHHFGSPVEAVSLSDPFDLGSMEPRLRAGHSPGAHFAGRMTRRRTRTRRWPYLLFGLLCGAVLICAASAAALYWLPREDLAGLQQTLAALGISPPSSIFPSAQAPATPPPRPALPPSNTKPQVDPAALARINSELTDFETRAAALQARGGGIWDGAELSAAQMQAAQANGAAAAGGLKIARQHLDQANLLLANVEKKAPHALAAELRAGDAALAAGNQQQANQAYAVARRIDPNSARASDGAHRARLLNGVLPLLSDARKAELARNYSRAAQDFSQALALDPTNTTAKAGLARVNAAFGNDSYARAVGAGFAALGAGRLADAQTDFQQALRYRPQGTEANEGVQRVSAAMRISRIASLRQQAVSLEDREHWSQAAAIYGEALREDPSSAFAERGKRRDEQRAALDSGMQEIIDQPERLTVPTVREEAITLLQQAREQDPAGPVLQSQIQQVEQLMPHLGRPVLINMISDNVTQVSIPSIGVFGAFGRREIHLKPGTYTVIGTRDGYRQVTQEVTVEPGQQNVTITVSCSEPI